MAELTHINEQRQSQNGRCIGESRHKTNRHCLRTHLHAAGDLYPDHRWKNKKGDVLAVAQVAGIMAAKNMGDHPNVPPVITDRRRHSF